ncbi:MAG: hypothetical protein ACODAQ_03210 [Phycisphaeraceae bacterium]
MSEQTPPDKARGADGRADDVQLLSPFPDHRDLYVLIAGVVLGVLLSGAVLGHLAPSLYNNWFVGGQDTLEQIEQRRAEQRQTLQDLAGTGVSRTAIEERRDQFERELEQLNLRLQVERAAHTQWLVGRLNALVLAILAVMVLEVLASPTVTATGRVKVPVAVSRLITVRYALIALWLAIVIARPSLLREVPITFLVLLMLVALAAAFVPLGRRGAKDSAMDEHR